MKSKTKDNIILILIILITLSLGTLLTFIFTDDSSYAVDLENQGTATNNNNVTFDMGFAVSGSRDITSHSTVANVNPEYTPIYINIGLISGCTLSNAKVQFYDSSNGTDLNWDVGFGSVTSEVIASSNDTTKTINFNTLSNGVNLRLSLYPEIPEQVAVSKLNETSKVVFTATCIDSSGVASSVYKEIYFNIGWTGTFTMDLAQYIKTYTRNNDQTVTIETTVTNKLNTAGKNSTLPVKQTNLVVDVPTYQGIAPTQVTVTAKKTIATNGKDESDVSPTFSSSNYNWNSGTGKLTITVDNPADASGKVACYRGADEYVITYTYPKAAYDAFTVPATITNKVTGTMTLYSNTSTIDITKTIDDTIDLEREIGTSPTAFGKRILYINTLANREIGLTMGRSIYVTSEEVTNVAAFRMEFTQLIFNTDSTTYNSYISGVNYAPIKNFRIPVDSFNEFLGASGYVRVYDTNFNLIGTINSSSTLNADNEYQIDIPSTYQSSTEKYILETSKPIANLTRLYINYDREIGGNIPFTFTQMQQLRSTEALLRLYTATTSDPTTFNLDEDKDLIIDTLDFADTYTGANINVVTPTLDASESDYQDLELKIVLDDSTDFDDVWQTPSFDIELPSYIIGIKSSFEYSMNYDSTTNIAFGQMSYRTANGKIHAIFNCTGVQKYKFQTPTTIILKFKVKVNKYASNLAQEVKLYYINSAVNEYKNPGTWAATPSTTGEVVGFPIYSDGTECGIATSEINFVTDTKLLCVSEISNYDGTSTINSLDNKDEAADIGRNGAFPTMTLIAQNNHTVPVSNITLLGRIPYTGNTYAISGGDLGTNIDTVLTSTLNQLTNNVTNVTIYYSDNLNATRDLNLATNNWTTTTESLSTIKSYLIVINDTLDVGEQVRFSYDFYVPPESDYKKSLFANFGAYYDSEGIENTEESAKIGLTTGTGPVLTAEKTSSIPEGNTVKKGDIITYTITINNSGEVDAENVVITDNIPANTTYVISDGTGGYIKQPSTRTITENIGTIVAGGTYTYSFSVIVEDIATNTTISNTANITADGIEDVPSTTSSIPAVTSAPNLTITKTSSIPNGQRVKEGDEITYTIIVRNDGDGIAENVVIHDAIPKNTTYKDPITGVRDPDRESISSAPKDVLAPGETYQFQFTVVVDPITENTIIQNAATVTYDEGERQNSNTVEISATTTDPILRVEKTSSIPTGQSVKEGDLITYTITVYNDGFGIAQNITIKDNVPIGTTYYDTTLNATNPEITEISETRATLNPGESFSVSFTVQVGRISTTTEISNTATVTGDNVPDTSSNTNAIPADITVPELRAEKTSSIAEGQIVKEGDIITYTITVYNDGDTPAYNVIISDIVPEHTIYYDNNVKDTSKRIISYVIPILEAGESETYSFTVIVDEIPENGTIQNAATVSAENSPEIPTNVVDIDSQISVPQLSLNKTSSVGSGETIKSGDIITYTITVTNIGDCNAHDVIISDTVPEYTIYAEKVGNQYISDATKKNVTKTIEVLEPGESATLEFSVIVEELNGNVRISNTAKVNANNGEETSSNTVGISAEPKDNTNTGELPYTGNYSLVIILVIAIVSIGGFSIYEYRRFKKLRR